MNRAPWLSSFAETDLLLLNVGHDPTSLPTIQEALFQVKAVEAGPSCPYRCITTNNTTSR